MPKITLKKSLVHLTAVRLTGTEAVEASATGRDVVLIGRGGFVGVAGAAVLPLNSGGLGRADGGGGRTVDETGLADELLTSNVLTIDCVDVVGGFVGGRVRGLVGPGVTGFFVVGGFSANINHNCYKNLSLD